MRDQTIVDLRLEPIGHLRTPFREKFGTPRQGSLVPSSQGLIELRPELQPRLITEGLKSFSHLWLITWFHQLDNSKPLIKVEPPRLGGKRLGALATRSPHHPNPLGLTLVRLLELEDSGRIIVSGIDLMDGTPILDIKPYVTEADRPEGFTSGWVEEHPWPRMPTQFLPSFARSLAALTNIESLPCTENELQDLIRETLALDPRSTADRAKLDPDRDFWLRLYDYDVRFRFTHAGIDIHWIRFARGSEKYRLFSDDGPEGSEKEINSRS